MSETESSGAEAGQEDRDLKGAIEKLQIKSVFLMNSSTMLGEKFSPAEFSEKDYLVQSYMRRAGSGISDDVSQYGFSVALGQRLVRKEDAEKAHNQEDYTCVEVRGEFLAIYIASNPLTDGELEAFHKNNVLYHIWPYWREFVQQMCWRMGAPFMTVPMLRKRPKLE